MKSIKIIAIAILTVSASALHAADPGAAELKVQVIPKADETYRVIYDAETKTTVKVNIYNDRNQRIFSERIRETDGFSKPYNFRGLPEGKYLLEIISNGATTKKEIHHVAKAEVPVKAFVYPLQDAHKFQLMVMGNEMVPVTIGIFDENNRELYKEEVNAKENFGKVYNLSKFDGQSARFVITSKKKVLKDQSFNL